MKDISHKSIFHHSFMILSGFFNLLCIFLIVLENRNLKPNHYVTRDVHMGKAPRRQLEILPTRNQQEEEKGFHL